MAELRSEKYVNNLPGVLIANTIYFIRKATKKLIIIVIAIR